MSNEKTFYILSVAWFVIAIFHALNGTMWAVVSIILAIGFLIRGMNETKKRRNKPTDTEKE